MGVCLLKFQIKLRYDPFDMEGDVGRREALEGSSIPSSGEFDVVLNEQYIRNTEEVFHGELKIIIFYVCIVKTIYLKTPKIS